MLIQLTIQKREAANREPTYSIIGIDPYSIARVEQDDDEIGIVHLWCDGMEKPYRVVSEISELIKQINALTCEQAHSGTG